MKAENHAIVILDASGSMCGQESRVRDSVKEFVHELESNTYLSIFQFDGTRWESLFTGFKESWKKLNKYKVNGTTPLYDAIGRGIEYGQQFNAKKTMVMVETDGYENHSTFYNFKKITNLINQQKEDGWEFLFMGSDLSNQGAHDLVISSPITEVFTTTISSSHINKHKMYRTAADMTNTYFNSQDDNLDKERKES